MSKTASAPSKNPLRATWNGVSRLLPKKKEVLVCIGLHEGEIFDRLFRKYRHSYGFEADPELFKRLEARYRKYENVHLINAAVANYEGQMEFSIHSDEAVTSPAGHPVDQWQDIGEGNTQTVQVPCINLFYFLAEHNISHIDDYISSIRGMDFEVLKTLKLFIDSGKIGTITCEVTKNGKGNNSNDAPDNSEIRYYKLLEENYDLVARGRGYLRDGMMREIPEDWWGMDCKWRLKG